MTNPPAGLPGKPKLFTTCEYVGVFLSWFILVFFLNLWFNILKMNDQQSFEVSWAYGETTFINASDEAEARRIAVGMGRALGLGRVLWVLPAQVV